MENYDKKNTNIFERSLSSDDTDFFDLPLPPVPEQCVEIQNLDLINSRTSPNEYILFGRVNVFDDVSIDSLEEIRSSSSTDDKLSSNLINNNNNCRLGLISSSSDSSSYREKSPNFKSQPSSPEYMKHDENFRKNYIEFCGL